MTDQVDDAAAPIWGLAGPPSAMVAAEGVLHAEPPDVPWTLPSLDLLEEGFTLRSDKDEVMRTTRLIEETLAQFGVRAKIFEVSVGPVFTRYALHVAAGDPVARLEGLVPELSLALARTLSVEAPTPGLASVGIDVPNNSTGLVTLKDVTGSAMFTGASSKLTIALGRDVPGSPIVADLALLPHLLIGGRGGSGKTALLNTVICSLLMAATPDEVRLILADPKRTEFARLARIPHLVVPVLTESRAMLNALHWAAGEMDRRFRLLNRGNARSIELYNSVRSGPDRLPYLVCIFDDITDLAASSPSELEKALLQLTGLGRAAGVHLILATQRPSVTLTHGVRAQIPARIAFLTTSAEANALAIPGAETLIGRGDMFLHAPDGRAPIRIQGAFVSDREMAALAVHWKRQTAPDDGSASPPSVAVYPDDTDIEDDRYAEAVEIVRRAGEASVSMLQRKMVIGFARAGRLIDILEQEGVIGPSTGPGKMRKVFGAPSDPKRPTN